MLKLFNIVPVGTEVRHRMTGEVGIVTSSGPWNVNVTMMQEQHAFVLGQWVTGKAMVGRRWRVALIEPVRVRAGLVLGEQ